MMGVGCCATLEELWICEGEIEVTMTMYIGYSNFIVLITNMILGLPKEF